MLLSEGIRRIGFRKWYERTLLASHAHLVLCFLCLIGVFAAFEAAGRFTGREDRLTDVAAILVCTGTGLWALRRYLGLMARAESAANQAECPHCRAYGRIELQRAEASGDEVEVRCRKCGHGWRIEP
jgi:predicted Zn finger-like uncharacterized protein